MALSEDRVIQRATETLRALQDLAAEDRVMVCGAAFFGALMTLLPAARKEALLAHFRGLMSPEFIEAWREVQH